jgi:outer membrane protein assembly factor BamB
MRLSSVALACLVACSTSCSDDSPSGPQLPAQDYADRFTGVWYGSVSGSRAGDEIPPQGAATEITSDSPNHVALSGVCPDGSPAQALVTGPATLWVARTTCPAVQLVGCDAVTFDIESGFGILTNGTLSVVFDGVLRGCGTSEPIELVFGGSRTPPQPPVSPAPTIAELEPTGATAGDPQFELTVRGSGFVEGSQVAWNYHVRPTTFVSGIELRATISAEDLAVAGTKVLNVVNPGGATSGFATFDVVNPVPTLVSVAPDTVIVGSPGATLTVTGTRFAHAAIVSWNAEARPTTFVSTTELRVDLYASDLVAQGVGAVTVRNPAPGGGEAPGDPVQVTLAAAVPAPSAVAPASVPPGHARFTLTVAGSGFAPTSTVRWEGSDRPTAMVSPTVLHATISAADVAVEGSAEVSVYTPPPGGGTASAGTVAIAAPAARAAHAVAYQLEPGHSGRTSLGAPLVLPDAPAWSVALRDLASYPLIAGGKVFVITRGSSTGWYGTQLHALDLATGALVWGPVEIPATYFSSGHAYEDGRVFVLDFDGNLRAFDAESGAALWTRQLGAYATSAPTAIGGVVYAGAGSLYAVDAADGAIRWRSTVSGGDHSSPAVALDGVFVSRTCNVRKADLLTGSEIWNGGGTCSGGGGRTAAYAADRLYVRDPYAGQLPVGAAYDALDGVRVGTFGTNESRMPIPAVGDDAMYLVSYGTLRRFDLAGTDGWTFTGDATLSSAPLLVDDAVVVGSGSGKVFMVDAATGVERWSGDAGAGILGPDEHNVSSPLTGLGVGEGYLVVPAGSQVTAWKIVGP